MSAPKCQAAAMDAAAMLGEPGYHDGDSVPPCDEPGSVEWSGFVLCEGCADALDFLIGFGRDLSGPVGGA